MVACVAKFGCFGTVHCDSKEENKRNVWFARRPHKSMQLTLSERAADRTPIASSLAKGSKQQGEGKQVKMGSALFSRKSGADFVHVDGKVILGAAMDISVSLCNLAKDDADSLPRLAKYLYQGKCVVTDAHRKPWKT